MVNGLQEKIYQITTEAIHYSKMKEFCKNIIYLCKKFDIQIFATTHSLDFQKALITSIEQESISIKKLIKLIKLQENKDKSIKAITYPYNEFQYLVESETETR